MDAARPATFGTLLRRYRLAADLTQEQLAERAHVSRRSIGDLERDGPHTPRKDTVALLAETLALSPRERGGFVEAARQIGVPSRESRAALHGALYGSASAPFVGRRLELALLERHLAGEGPPVLLVAGEPGIGKSRLLREAAPHAHDCGWTVLAGGCQRQGGQVPYAPVLGALKRHLQAQRAGSLRAALAGCAWLARLLPELETGTIAPLPRWTLPPEQERRLMFDAVARFLGNVAGPAGTLLMLDDLQWAGTDALDLLATLVRAAGGSTVRVIGAYRDTEMQPWDPLATLLADLAHAGLAAHHALAPLAPEEMGHLLDGLLQGTDSVGSAVRQRVLQRAGGVPFFIVSCAQALQVGDRQGRGGDAVPWDVAQGVRQRVAALSMDAQAVLGTAAVVGRMVPRAVLVAAARQEGKVLAALDAACRAGLLIEEGAHAYQFAHDVIREVVEADLGAARRTMLHRRVAEALEGQPGEPPIERMAYHYARSDRWEQAMRYLEQAGDQAARRYAHAAAEGYYRELVGRLEEMRRVREGAAAREKLGAVLRTAARYEAALEILERAVETYQAAEDLESLGRVLAEIGHVHGLRGTPDEGIRRLQPLLETLAANGPSHGLAAMYVPLAINFWQSGRYNEQLAAAEHAVDLASAMGDDRILGDALWARGLALVAVGRLTEGLPVMEEALRLAEAAGNLYVLSHLLNNLGEAFRLGGEFAKAAPFFERARSVGEQLGDPAQIIFLMTNRAFFAFNTGNWERARQEAEQAAALSQQIGSSWVEPIGLALLGVLCLAQGDWAMASTYLEDSLSMVEASGDLQGIRDAQSWLAERDLLEGRPDAARARLVPLLDRPGLREFGVTRLIPLLAWAYLDLGDEARAQEVVEQAIARSRTQNDCLTLTEALRIQAMVATRQERWEEAEIALEEGMALASRMPYPYAQARLLYTAARLHARQGAPGLARTRFEAALGIFRRLGASKDAERVEQAIATLPVGWPVG